MRFFLTAVLAMLIWLPHPARAVWQVDFDSATGNYTLVDRLTGWKLTGSVSQKVASTNTESASDPIGKYTSIRFAWDEDGPLTGEIRSYNDQAVVMFVLTCPTARSKPPRPFPTLTTPGDLHTFGYSNKVFSPPSFKSAGGGSPWMFFDDSAHAMVLSPASNFMTADVTRDKTNQLACGWMPTLANLPGGFTQRTLLVSSSSINKTWETWGTAMTDLAGKHRPANDANPEIAKFGYWTDNGSHYYYNFDPQDGYGGTLVKVVEAYRKLNIPLAYMQLDSWWYEKTTTGADGKPGGLRKTTKFPDATWNCYGGLTEYVAHPFVFPQGLAGFQKELGLPLITHNRWIDVASPYRQKYKISGVGAIDPRWWDAICDYLKPAGVDVYEQDWLNIIYNDSPEFSSTTTAGDAFMDGMARATAAHGMTMQYCMGLPRHYLQGSKYDNLTTVRVSNDRFERSNYDWALYTSRLATALGEWPWVDTFRSSETPNMILATLTAGMVGVADELTKIDTANIARSIRADGVIVKPDTAIVPLDRTYLSDATTRNAPMIAAAYTDHGADRTAYVFSYPRNADQMQIAFSPTDLGFTSDVFVFEPATGKAKRVAAKETFTSGFADANPKSAWAYFVVAMVQPSGIALIGDTGKIATAGRQRIAAIERSGNGLSATVTFAAGEKSITLMGYSPSSPAITATGGAVEPVNFDRDNGQFQVAVSPTPGTLTMHLKISVK